MFGSHFTHTIFIVFILFSIDLDKGRRKVGKKELQRPFDLDYPHFNI